jgi:23S rRNA (adenine2503-C2)-methyltransferase
MSELVLKEGISDYTPEEIAEKLGLKKFQGKQIFQWIHGKKEFNFDAMTNLSKEMRRQLSESYTANRLKLVSTSDSESTGTRKVLLGLHDGETVESVMLRNKERITLCISSQVGCAVKCSFCATGLSGYARNLSPGEIVEQALYLLAEEKVEDRNPNIVYMGMGEPFRNYESVVKSIQLLMNNDGLGIGARRITVSTAGEVDGIRKFAREDWQVRLSVSLHAATDEKRDVLVPLNRKYDLKRLGESIADYRAISGRQITFEWTLIDGVNDSKTDAEALAEYAKRYQAFVNLIPYNPVAGLDYKPPAPHKSKAFQQTLLDKGVKATLRYERGQDIDAACGQLRRHTIAH